MQNLPDKDTALLNTEQGMYRKYHVYRADLTDQPGGKHHGCQHFVLDLTHDPYAKTAILAYAEACRGTHPQLSADILQRYGGINVQPSSSS